jgi:hypothetical protein
LVTTLAAETIPATTVAGVTLVDAHGKRSMAASDPLVEPADALQYQFDYRRPQPALPNLAHLIKADLRMPSRSRCGVRRVVVAGACISAAGSSVSVSAAA